MRFGPVYAALAATVVCPFAKAQEHSADVIDVIGTTPLGGKLDANRIAANVQTATAEELRDQAALDLADFMKRSLGSVFVNEAQSNPLQPDVQYRGFIGSPLLGLPQGLAIYQDGVRINEPFGDTVNWALIPENAIDTVAVVPGSNPLYGLNALGGAIAIRTKDGFTSGGTRAELLGGSFGRLSLQAENGGDTGRMAYFVAGSHFEEDGWRDYSPTNANQLFGKLSVQGEDSRLDVTLTEVATDLVGNGAAPVDLLELDKTAVFTRPDETHNRLTLLGLSAERDLTPNVALRGTLYWRASDIATLNGDDADYAECTTRPGLLCETTGGAQTVLESENGEPLPFDRRLAGAAVNRTHTQQSGAGFGIQADFTGDLGGRANLLSVGLLQDRGRIAFAAQTELGALDTTRLAVPGGAFVNEAFVQLDADLDNTGLFLSNTFSLSPRTALTLSGRYNRARIELRDRLGDELNGEHTFARFNPAVGLTLERNAVTYYVGYGTANRAPSPVELTCADEDAPCRLPNAFLSDPPLEQVVARTFEGGLRGRWRNGRWHAGVFRTTNDDDIVFVSAGAFTNQGFFDNVGRTRRAGFESSLTGNIGDRIDWSIDYTRLDATFLEEFTIASTHNPRAVAGEIAVQPGDRLPLVPRQLLKAGLRVGISDAFGLGADVYAAAGMRFRGDEANLVDEIEGHTLLSLRAEYRLSQRAAVFATLDNALDEEYATFGVFGEPDDVLGDGFEDPRFIGPGAPRALWVGVRLTF